MTTTCFWSILTLKNLEFIFVPSAVSSIKISGQAIGDFLLHRSLFEFMHPNETELAKSDLATFFRLKTLAGSVTRCRLLSLQNIADLYANKQDIQAYLKSNNVKATDQNKFSWSIVDLVIYTAANDAVLVCFHNTDLETYVHQGDIIELRTSCQSSYRLTEQDISNLTRLMIYKEVPRSEPEILPIRIFQIVDQAKGLPLFIWPPSVSSRKNSIIDLVQTISKEMLLKEFKSSAFDQQQNEILCTRHFYASSKQEFFDQTCLFQRILIPYGNIIFESFQVSSIENSKPSASFSFEHSYHKSAPTSLASPLSSLRHDTMLKSDGQYYNSIHSIISGPPSASSTTTELAVGEIEHQMLPGNLLATVTTRSQEDSLYHDQSPSPLFQKFRLNQQVAQQESPIERRKKVVFNGQQHYPFFTPPITDVNNSTSTNNVSITKMCTRCRTSNSPEWRRGPDGHKTLCNACGLRYSRLRSKQWRTAASNKQ